MIKRCTAALLALVVLSLAQIQARATTYPQQPNSVDAAGLSPTQPFQNADFLGNSQIGRIELSTASFGSVQFVSGSSGIVYEVTNSSGSAADACILWDVATANLPASTQAGFNQQGYRISPEVLSAGGSATGCTTGGVCEDWRPIRPIRFQNGLAAQRKGSSKCLAFYRLDSDDAVTPVTK